MKKIIEDFKENIFVHVVAVVLTATIFAIKYVWIMK